MPHFSRPLRFVESTEDGYGIYEDRATKREVFLADGSGRVVVYFSDLDVDHEWSVWSRTNSVYNREMFLDVLRAKVIRDEQWEIDEIDFCEDCHQPNDEDYMHSARGSQVCESCIQNYNFCEGCDEYETDGSYVYDEYWRCEGCVDNNYHYCDHCDIYVEHDDYDHEHNEDCNCDVPGGVQFTVPNDGNEPLANDTRTTVHLPAGILSDEGVGAIARLIRSIEPMPDNYYMMGYEELEASDYYKWQQLSMSLDEIGSTWAGKRGNYPKRLSRHAYTTLGLRIPPHILSEVGNIGAQHSKGADVRVEVTRDLNLDPEAFAHGGSCWWTEYSSSRCTLKSNGGFGLRTFTNDNEADAYGSNVSGRAWVLPLKRVGGDFRPTTNTMKADAYVVFNGYGDLDGYTAVRTMAHMTGMTYRKVGFSGGDMYVNNDSGYLVTTEEIAAEYDGETGRNASIYLSLDSHADLYHREAREAAKADECNHFEVCNHVTDADLAAALAPVTA